MSFHYLRNFVITPDSNCLEVIIILHRYIRISSVTRRNIRKQLLAKKCLWSQRRKLWTSLWKKTK
uniref:Uncharacterized protein n=1 Tax=Octopus bimaculoides TaxID=37653 RepID=A0A0L8H9Z2_OCTBM